ncbi:hypothetical protein [Novosphingobium mangrovi (ex Huang et al. 2023)]|uniref:Uncharacterized protein n=1 Tax=Novosphingobium mangrovi (ex Huang et al. 2023) TaxID=2976432 RepID=A0ABT2I2J4_9SPHN|nr:hypothetical protein [Novosphingobium mangrovi (ex Huang et al. 2023)]MCT2399024.1 hypothetical protein [Novosphingobium mangrovi (ex Huang et al. 2023)]
MDAKTTVEAGREFPNGQRVAPNKRIDSGSLGRLRKGATAEFWRTGQWKKGPVEYFGVRFCQEDIDKVVKDHAGSFASTAVSVVSTASGRTSEKHGEPIATLALRLGALPLEELNRISPTQLRKELAKEYSRIGCLPPSEKNLNSIAAGVRRAVVAKKHEISLVCEAAE